MNENDVLRLRDYLHHIELAVARIGLPHGYFTVDLDVVWKTVCEDLPTLAKQVRALRGALQ